MIASERQIEKFQPYKDGVITSRNTFQKYYTQQDLRDYINETLEVSSIPITAGVFGVFRDEDLEFEYLSKKYHRRKIGLTSDRSAKLRVKNYKQSLTQISSCFRFLANVLINRPIPEED